jgi:hypothetical protein
MRNICLGVLCALNKAPIAHAARYATTRLTL